jgi:hypothetical protein
MVKKTKTPPKRPPGRPKIDPTDLRTIRFSFRLHPDLYAEIQRQARIKGQHLSIYVERAAIEAVHRDVGQPILDTIGKYTGAKR